MKNLFPDKYVPVNEFCQRLTVPIGALPRLLALLVVITQSSLPVSAAEPYERFLERLREQGYYDLALSYLDDISHRPALPEEFREAIEFERSLLWFQSANLLAPKSPQRAERLDQAESALRKFVDSAAKHPRRGEARLKLGGLLRLRAEEARAAADAGSGQEISLAVKFYSQAHELFEGSIAELAEIESQLKGNRVDPNDRQQVAYREKIRSELREAQLLSAKAVDDRGRSRAVDSSERLQDLEKAMQMFSSLYTKEQRMIGIRNYALFYRSDIQQLLGRNSDALDGYQRILDLEGVDVLRPLQTDAMAKLVKLLAAEGKFELASDRASKWLEGLSKEESNWPEALALSLEYAQMRVQWIKKLESEEPNSRTANALKRSTRNDLKALMRTSRSHADQTKELLTELGVETDQAALSTQLPQVKDFGQALEEAQLRIDRADATALEIAVIDQRLADAGLADAERQSLSTQRSQVISEVDRLRSQSLDLLREGLKLFNRQSDDRGQLFNARFRMAYLLLKLEQLPQAVVVGQFVSRSSPGTNQGLSAASIVLRGFSELLRRPDADHESLMSELAPYAEYLVATWPQSTEATAAAGALAQMAITAQNWDQAEKYLQLLPQTSEGIAKQYFQLGGALFDRFQSEVRTSGIDSPETVALGDRAAKWLQLAAEKVGADDPVIRLSIGNALAQLRLSQGHSDQAAQALIAGPDAPIRWLETSGQEVSSSVRMDVYRTAVRIVAAQMVDGQIDAQAAATQMRAYVDSLQQSAGAEAADKQRLQTIFTAVAKDLKDKLALVEQPEKRRQFSDVVLLVVGAAANSDAFATQYWAASTLLSLAQELASQPDAVQQAKPAFEKTAQLLQQMVNKAAEDPQWVQPENAAMQLKVLLAQASQGAEDFRTALQTYGEILDQNENLLDVQIQVAQLLQQVAKGNTVRYKSAIRGARPNAKTNGNTFWGWGKISQVTSKRMDQYAKEFFEARYQLANCQALMARSQSDPAASAADFGRAERAIQETYSLYPEMGGSESRQRFETLLKSIQQEVGKPVTGFPSQVAD